MLSSESLEGLESNAEITCSIAHAFWRGSSDFCKTGTFEGSQRNQVTNFMYNVVERKKESGNEKQVLLR